MKVDLLTGVLPISKAASSLAKLIRQVQQSGNPVAITQKGYPQAILVSVEAWTTVNAELEQLRARVAELEGGAA